MQYINIILRADFIVMPFFYFLISIRFILMEFPSNNETLTICDKY